MNEPLAPDARRARRLAEVIGAVARQALADWGVRRIALLDDDSAEADLAARILGEALPQGALVRVAPEASRLESLLQSSGTESWSERELTEARRFLARLLPDALPAGPASKTALLLGGALPPEPFFPLGDLYASEIAQLTGSPSVPAELQGLVERAGGVERLDRALRGYLDARDPHALERLPDEARAEVLARLAAGEASRLTLRLVPKIGSRTLGVDLFE